MSSSRSSRSRRFPVRHPVVVVDIGCSCRRPKLSLSSIFSSFRSFKTRKAAATPDPSTTSTTSTTSLWDTSAAATTTTTEDTPSPEHLERMRRRRMNRRRRKAAAEAVEKESSEPYLDFKESMLQMIVENEMYGWDDLNDLLHRLLSLNSPDNHPLILRAFADIWKGILAPSADE